MADVEALMKEFRNNQEELQKIRDNHNQALSKMNENDMVMKELAILPDSSNVFKLIGPALVKQDPEEAKANVKTRMDYIRKDLKRSDERQKEIEAKLLELRGKIVAAQQAKQKESESE